MQSNMSAPLSIARRFWGMSLVRGIVAIIFGLVAILWPHLTFTFFMLVFGIFAIVEGIILLGSAFTQRSTDTSAPTYARRADQATRAGESYPPNEASAREHLAYGGTRDEETHGDLRPPHRLRRNVTERAPHRASRMTLVAEGILSICAGILALILPTIIGALAFYVVAAWALIKGIGALAQTGAHGWVLGLIGVLGVILFLIVFFRPITFIHSLLWIVGVFSLIMGVLLVIRGLTHNAMHRKSRPAEPSY